MIIKPSKFEKFIFYGLVICLLFAVTLKSEKIDVKTSVQTETCDIPIIMYHHITTKKNYAGKYTIMADEFEEDLKYLKNNGYTTVTVQDLINFTENNDSLPDKPIIITFDDGFESFYVLAYPLLKKYESKAIVTIIGNASEKYSDSDEHNINYSNLTWQQIRELNESNLVEIQSHGYDMHKNTNGTRKGMSRQKGESLNVYRDNLSSDLKKLQELLYKNCSVVPNAVAYPYGAFNKDTLDVVKSCGFKCTFTCEERINTVVKNNTDSLYNLGRFNRESGISTEMFFDRVFNR